MTIRAAELIQGHFKCGHVKAGSNIFNYVWNDYTYRVCRICKAKRNADYRKGKAVK